MIYEQREQSLIFFAWDLRIQLVPSVPLNNAFTAKGIIHLHLLVRVTDNFWRSDPDSHCFKNTGGGAIQ